MSLALKSTAGVFSNTNEKSDKGFMTSETGDCHLRCAILVRAVGWALISYFQVYDDVPILTFQITTGSLNPWGVQISAFVHMIEIIILSLSYHTTKLKFF